MTEFIALISPIVVTFLAATMPVLELRWSIPLGVFTYDMHPLDALLISILGNLVPMFFILYLFEPIQRYLSNRSEKAKKFFDWLYERTRNKLDAKYKKYGLIALGLFVALPLPGSGVWTGAIAAWLFGVKRGPALAVITLGTIAAGLIVTMLTVGARNIIS